MGIFFQTEFADTTKTHFMFNNFFPKKPYLLRDNVEKYGRTRQATDDNIIRSMSIACYITKATDTHSEYVIIIVFFQRQKLLGEGAANVIAHCLYRCYNSY